jgi:hypothetical protein
MIFVQKNRHNIESEARKRPQYVTVSDRTDNVTVIRNDRAMQLKETKILSIAYMTRIIIFMPV